MKAKENILRAIRHDNPQWVPNGMEAVAWVGSPVVDRPNRADRDAFGVLWAYDEEAQGGTYPAHGGHPISDLRAWRNQLTMPDLKPSQRNIAFPRAIAMNAG